MALLELGPLRRAVAFALNAAGEPESIADMKTYYKPTQWRGKRVIYASIDPAEHKKQTVIGWVVISIVVLGLGVFAWLTR